METAIWLGVALCSIKTKLGGRHRLSVLAGMRRGEALGPTFVGPVYTALSRILGSYELGCFQGFVNVIMPSWGPDTSVVIVATTRCKPWPIYFLQIVAVLGSRRMFPTSTPSSDRACFRIIKISTMTASMPSAVPRLTLRPLYNSQNSRLCLRVGIGPQPGSGRSE